jgi:hypothetical protein
MTPHCVIAHLSDIHIGKENKDVLVALKNSLQEPPTPHFIVVTGDLSDHSKASELEEARKFLEEVVRELKNKGHDARCLVVPGNHDVDRWNFGWAKTLKNWNAAFPNTSFGRTDNLCSQSIIDERALQFCECYPRAGLVFLKFNSNVERAWGINFANGRVGETQLKTMREMLDRHEKADPNFKSYRKIALVHHHVHYLPKAESDRLFLMKDAGLFWRKMIDWDVELILHGHKHYATHVIIRYLLAIKDLGREERELLILSAGSAAHQKCPPQQLNSYYKIECEAFRCRAHHFEYRDLAFKVLEAPIEFRNLLRLQIPDSAEAVDVAALESMLLPEDTDMDAVNYSEIVYEAHIDASRNYTMTVTFNGLHDGQTNHIDIPVVVVAAREHLPLKCYAYDCLTNSPLANPVYALHPRNVDKLHVRVAIPPASAGQPFCVRIGIRIPSLMYAKSDYDAVGLARFRGKLGRFAYILRSELEPHGVHCFAVHRQGSRKLEFRPIELEPPGVAQELAPEGGPVYVVRPRTATIADLGDGLVCYYEKLG